MTTVIGVSSELQKAWENVEQDYKKAQFKPIPKGWVSIKEYAKMTGISEGYAHRKLIQLENQKLVEASTWPSTRGAPMLIYRPLKPKK